jgi:sulfate permease, SulP family
MAVVVAAAIVLVLFTRLTRWPVLGLIAAGGLVWGSVSCRAGQRRVAESGIRATIVALMVLPQIALTLTNSVLGTQRAARDYYGERAHRVTPRRLLQSLGIGNLIVGAFGGMPYCHGSGGVTAHYRGGSRTSRSNAIIGATLLVMSGVLVLGGGGLPEYPAVLQALLIGVIGWFHFQLARPSWQLPHSRTVLLLMGMTALIFANMLAVLIVGAVALLLAHYLGYRFPTPQAPGCEPNAPDNAEQALSQ